MQFGDDLFVHRITQSDPAPQHMIRIPVNGFEGVRLFCYYGYYSKFGLMDKTKGSD